MAELKHESAIGGQTAKCHLWTRMVVIVGLSVFLWAVIILGLETLVNMVV